MTCQHEDFDAHCEVHRLLSDDDGPVVGYMVELRVRCHECGEPFVFRGAPVGLSQHHPTLEADGTELRAPIIPQSADPAFGLGLPGYAMRVREGEAWHGN